MQQQIVRYDDEDVGDREEIIFRFFSRRKKDADDFHEWIEKWFLDAISRIERFDRFLEECLADYFEVAEFDLFVVLDIRNTDLLFKGHYQ